MPLFYNTASPTPTTKNNITDIAVNYGIRDFLLNKNIGVNTGGFYPQISTNINGSPHVGEPNLDTSINNNTNVIPIGLPLETFGLFRYNNAILPNQFKDDDPNAPILLNIEDIPITQGIFGNIDFPQGTQSYPTTATQEVTDYGLLGKTIYANFLNNATLYNIYVDKTQQVDMSSIISLQPVGVSQQLGSYADEYGNLNLGDSSAIQASSIIGSVLNGQGLGLAKGGFVTNFDIRSSLTGRILSSVGLINDTKLGIIGAQQLGLALANNAGFNLEQTAFGSLNIENNLLSLFKNGSLEGLRQNYKITIPNSDLGRIGDYTSRILGFTLPTSYLTDAGSLFQFESNSSNIERANSMILNTGGGQVDALINSMNFNLVGTSSSGYDNPDFTPFRSGYAPGFINNRNQLAINPSGYAFMDADGKIFNFIIGNNNTDQNYTIPEINYNRSEMIEKYGFIDAGQIDGTINPYENKTFKSNTFTWLTDNGEAVNTITDNGLSFIDISVLPQYKKTLLSKTQKLFNDNGMKTIVSVKGESNVKSSQIQTANNGFLSKGSAVLNKSAFINGRTVSLDSTPNNVFCRAWTPFNRYQKVNNLIRNTGLNKQVPFRFEMDNSVLDDNGFVKIAPYKGETNIRNYMFSIENLAWHGNQNLLPVERGPGDLFGTKGRIMWFPPYDIQFSETSSANWETTNFIGRGEPIYTYNNTERSGNLSFKIIVDHPSYVNNFAGSNGPDDNYVASFFAGCIEDIEFLDTTQKSNLSQSQALQNTKTANIDAETPPPPFTIYFPNDISTFDYIYTKGYESSATNGIGTYNGENTKIAYQDNTDYNLNAIPYPIQNGTAPTGITDPSFFTTLKTYLTDTCPHCVVTINTYASPQGTSKNNSKLVTDRMNNTYAKLASELGLDSTRLKKGLTTPIIGGNCNPNGPTDTEACKKDRKADIIITFDANLAANDLPQTQASNNPNNNQSISQTITRRLYNELNYFEKLKDTDDFVFDKFREKIKYFHPAFHSTTPEGLNSRLTFLHQCTRQGTTKEAESIDNLAFGRAPVCILRVGDFYNTKIIIDSVQIDYEPLVWDLNPEGIGVQPMIASINLSFKFIGGSSLYGPINKLQNALSFNYYANSRTYDPRADYIAKVEDITTSLVGLTEDEVKKANENILIGNVSSSSTGGGLGLALVNGTNDINLYDNTTTITTTNSNLSTNNQTVQNDTTNGSSSPTVFTPTIEDEINDITLSSAEQKGDTLILTFNTQNVSFSITPSATGLSIYDFNVYFDTSINQSAIRKQLILAGDINKATATLSQNNITFIYDLKKSGVPSVNKDTVSRISVVFFNTLGGTKNRSFVYKSTDNVQIF